MGRVGIDLFEIRNQFCMLACSKNVHLITGTQRYRGELNELSSK